MYPAGISSVASLRRHVTFPDVDTTLLSGFGLGQGAYLIKKMAPAEASASLTIIARSSVL
jgi:hypothetical protein